MIMDTATHKVITEGNDREMMIRRMEPTKDCRLLAK
jgi:hypothetical protein